MKNTHNYLHGTQPPTNLKHASIEDFYRKTYWPKQRKVRKLLKKIHYPIKI